MDAKRYTRILTARYSPQNECNVEDGTVLYPKALPVVPMVDHLNHSFVSVKNQQYRAKYGWVTEVSPFSEEEFLKFNLSGVSISDADRQHIRVMLDSISKLAPGTPVAATYSKRGVESPRMEFTAHRVVLRK